MIQPGRSAIPGARSRAARRVRAAGVASLVGLSLAVGCARDTATQDDGVSGDAPGSRLVEMLPGVRIDVERRIVEFDGQIAVDCHDPETPDVYLEVVCCTPDTREHEALVVTRARPSHVHAALLAIGAEPGSPGGWKREGDSIATIPPTGDRVSVSIVTSGAGGSVSHDPGAWIVQAGTGLGLREAVPDSAWVFAGSRVRAFRGREVYDADGTGQLVGLHTFGGETVAWTRVESPDSWIDEPQWLARNTAIPPLGTPVVVRLELLGGPG